jgi:signal transduction histidine kinase/CheY-like chemotaxis protein
MDDYATAFYDYLIIRQPLIKDGCLKELGEYPALMSPQLDVGQVLDLLGAATTRPLSENEVTGLFMELGVRCAREGWPIRLALEIVHSYPQALWQILAPIFDPDQHSDGQHQLSELAAHSGMALVEYRQVCRKIERGTEALVDGYVGQKENLITRLYEQLAQVANFSPADRPSKAGWENQATLYAASATSTSDPLQHDLLLHTQKLESLRRMAGGIAHDFNNLLTIIVGNVEMAQLEAEPASALNQFFTPIQMAVGHATNLTDQMLTYSGLGPFRLQSLNLSSLIQEMAPLMQATVPKQFDLHYNLKSNLPLVEADSEQLRQLLMNLIMNAAEAIGQKSGTIRISTGINWVDRAYLTSTYLSPELPEGYYVWLEVVDNGMGIEPVVMSHIFEPYFTTHSTGRGLGLATVLGIVRGHKGTIKVTSQEGQGSIFRILLPARPVASAPLLPTMLTLSSTDPALLKNQLLRSSQAPVAPTKAFGKILIVDDEALIRKVASLYLLREGYEVLTAVNGTDGVQLYASRANEIGLVLLDLTMPVLGGEEALRQIIQINPQAKIILMSGYSEQEATSQYPDLNIVAFLPKPFRGEQLLELARNMLQC